MKREALWILSNAMKRGTQLQRTFLHEKGVLGCFISLLGSTDKKMLKVVLEGIFNFVEGGELLGQNKDENPFKRYLKNEDVEGIIGELQGHEDREVSRLAKAIIKML